MRSSKVINGKSVGVSGLEPESNVEFCESLPFTGVVIRGLVGRVVRNVGASSTTSGVILPGFGVAALEQRPFPCVVGVSLLTSGVLRPKYSSSCGPRCHPTLGPTVLGCVVAIVTVVACAPVIPTADPDFSTSTGCLLRPCLLLLGPPTLDGVDWSAISRAFAASSLALSSLRLSGVHFAANGV